MTEAAANQATLRADKWLWYARFFKSRSLATQLCQAGRLRLSGLGVFKPHHKVKPGDVLTFPQARHIRVVKVVAFVASTPDFTGQPGVANGVSELLGEVFGDGAELCVSR